MLYRSRLKLIPLWDINNKVLSIKSLISSGAVKAHSMGKLLPDKQKKLKKVAIEQFNSFWNHQIDGLVDTWWRYGFL